MPRPALAFAVLVTRRQLRVEARKKGYTPEQARRLVKAIKAATIRERLVELWAIWGPTVIAILKAVLALLPFLFAMEPPALPPVTDPAKWDAIEREEGGEALADSFVVGSNGEDDEDDGDNEDGESLAEQLGLRFGIGG